jgi:hypothetical protein
MPNEILSWAVHHVEAGTPTMVLRSKFEVGVTQWSSSRANQALLHSSKEGPKLITLFQAS